MPADARAATEARLALGEGQPARAVALLDPLFDAAPHVVIGNDLADAHWLAMNDRLARLYREVGRLDDADRIDARLRILLRYADDDHPIKRRLDVRR